MPRNDFVNVDGTINYDNISSVNQELILKGLLDSLSTIVGEKATQSDLVVTNATIAENTLDIALKTEINDIGTTGDTTETYSVDKILSLLNNKQNIIFIQTTQPAMLTDNIWIDTTSIPYKISRCDGVVYNQIGGIGTGGGTLLTDWVTNTIYTVNTSFVIYSNAIYRCISSHTSVTWDTLKWQLITNSSDESIDYDSYASVEDGSIYTIVDFKRTDGTLYLNSTLSNKNVNGYYETCTLTYYDTTGITIIKTVVWTFTYDTNGNIVTKEFI